MSPPPRPTLRRPAASPAVAGRVAAPRAATAPRAAAALAAAAACLTACGSPDRASVPSKTRDQTSQASRATTTRGHASAPLPPLCGALRTTTIARIADPALDELSGLALGRAHPDVLFAEEDSGGPAGVTAIRRGDGRVLGHVVIPGAHNKDWEDIATVRTRARGAELLLLENGEPRGVRIYRVPEPDPAGATQTAPAAAQRLRFPDGSHDVEALIADPRRDEVVVVTKDLFGGRAYAAPIGTGEATLRRGPIIDLSLVTAGDLSADGRTLALRTYSTLVVWQRRGDESLLRTLARPGCDSPADVGAEGQGEALALTADGRAAFSASEGDHPALHRYTVR